MASTLLTTTIKSVAGPDSGVARAVNRLPQARTNVSSNERWLSLAAGGALAVFGFGRGPTILSSALGAGLIYRATTGNCALYQALGVSTSDSTNPQTAIAA